MNYCILLWELETNTHNVQSQEAAITLAGSTGSQSGGGGGGAVSVILQPLLVVLRKNVDHMSNHELQKKESKCDATYVWC